MSEHATPPVPEFLPQPDLIFLVASLKMQAEMNLGLFPAGEGPDASPNLALARHAIDLLAVLAEKTKGNLTLEEQRFLDNSLTELRFRFVNASTEPAQP